jgi:rhamnose utilization protein RhaD (predicted bifunctional aldolase and dehydrogenase)
VFTFDETADKVYDNTAEKCETAREYLPEKQLQSGHKTHKRMADPPKVEILVPPKPPHPSAVSSLHLNRTNQKRMSGLVICAGWN